MIYFKGTRRSPMTPYSKGTLKTPYYNFTPFSKHMILRFCSTFLKSGKGCISMKTILFLYFCYTFLKSINIFYIYSYYMSYIIPPRLRRSDYTKGAITQDEYLKIAAANDANISAARKALKMGEVVQLTPIQSATPDELLADIGKQESDARSNLLRLGFRDLEASAIVAQLINQPDLLRMLNITYPAIEADIKRRFNPKLLTPTFFLEYLREYNDTINASRGLDVNSSAAVRRPLNALINSVAEIRTILPDQEQMLRLINRVKQISRSTQQTALLNPILVKLTELQNALPSVVDYSRIEQLGDANKFEVIQTLMGAVINIPTKRDIEEMVRRLEAGDMSALREIEALASSIDNQVKPRLDDILEEVRDVKEGIAKITPVKRKIKWDGTYPIDLDTFTILRTTEKRKYLKYAIKIGDITEYDNEDINIRDEKELIDIFDKYMSGTDFRKPPASPTASPSASPSASPIARGVADLRSERETKTDAEKKGKGHPTMMAKVESKKGRGLKKIKIGKGISVQEQPTYKEFGKYAIHIPQLEDQDVLNVKYKSLGGIPKFKPFPVSDIFRDFLLDLLNGKRSNERVYLQIEPNERKAFEEIAIGAGVWSGLGLKRTTTSDDEADSKRFEVLRGIYSAGNNSTQVLQELRRLVVKFMNNGKIKKNQGLELLMELSV